MVDWVHKNQPTGLESAAVLDPMLQRPQLVRNKHARMLASQAVEECFRRSIRLGFQPLHHAGPSRLENDYFRDGVIVAARLWT